MLRVIIPMRIAVLLAMARMLKDIPQMLWLLLLMLKVQQLPLLRMHHMLKELRFLQVGRGLMPRARTRLQAGAPRMRKAQAENITVQQRMLT